MNKKKEISIDNVKDETMVGIDNVKDETMTDIDNVEDETMVGIDNVKDETMTDIDNVEDETMVGIDNVKDETKGRASSVKIAYYVQRMLEKSMCMSDILPILLSQFNKRDLKKFGRDYGRCSYDSNIRRIANFTYVVSRK